jgi:hypothetical protein
MHLDRSTLSNGRTAFADIEGADLLLVEVKFGPGSQGN